jgi:glycosyltransferase involved in cell wall biosynthesis
MDRPYRVYFVCGDKSGPFYHDIGIPTKYFNQYKLLECVMANYINLDEMHQCDMIFFQRQYAPESILAQRSLKEQGMPCIAHVDDNVWEIPPYNPAHKVYQGALLKRFEQMLVEAHAVTTSTEYLYTLCKKFNPNVYCFRNLIETGIMDFKDHGRDITDQESVRIGWTGTPHHLDDIVIVEQALKEICRMHPNVKLVFFGFMPPHIQEMVDPLRIEFYSFVPSETYYLCLAKMDIDIGIAPLVQNGFNRGKTARKAQEYGALRIAPVLTDWDTYAAWTDEVNCIKPKKNRHIDWVKSLDRLVTDATLRDRIASGARDFVLQNHAIDKFIMERAQTYIEIHNKVKSGEFK